jgi:hypothetical protein
VSRRASDGRIELKPTQRRVIAVLNDDGVGELTRSRYQELASVSRSQAAYDLAELVEAGALERLGNGRTTRYRLVRREQPGQRHWTAERIRSALTEFCAGRESWPTAGEFKAAGRADLYVAASRYGGIRSWASELGFAKSRRAVALPVRTPTWRPRARWAAGVAIVAALAAAAGGATLVTRHDAAPRVVAQAKRPVVSHVNKQQATAPARKATKPTAQARARSAPSKQRPVTRTVVRHVVVETTATPQRSLAAEHVSTPRQTTSSAATHETSTPTSTGSGTPAPLRAPSGGGGPGPNPIKPPGS